MTGTVTIATRRVVANVRSGVSSDSRIPRFGERGHETEAVVCGQRAGQQARFSEADQRARRR